VTLTQVPAGDQLIALAAGFGVEPGYWDVTGQWHDAAVGSVLAVLEALGAPIDVDDAARSEAGRRRALDELLHELELRRLAPVDPVVCVVSGRPVDVELRWPRRADGREDVQLRVEVVLEASGSLIDEVELSSLDAIGSAPLDGNLVVRRRLPIPGSGGVPVGYHQLRIDDGTTQARATLLVAPEHVHQLGPLDRLWGVFAPVYSLRQRSGLGPDLGGLAQLARWTDRHGGRIVATLPMLSAYLDAPGQPSPYSPVSRRFWNESYLDLARLPELESSAAARAVLERPDVVDGLLRARDGSPFDVAARAGAVRPVLAELATSFFGSAPGAPGFDRWVEAHPLVVDYARFRAVAERRGCGWHDWPARLQAGDIEPDDYDVRVAARHVYAQWSMDRQLAELAEVMASAEQRLYLDLPVGAAADGFDTWIDRDDYAWGASVGAPPDEFFAAGQNWGFPPMRPDAARAQGHRHLAECLRHHMAHAGMLRLDHVMGLHRLFYVPEGLDATEGVYVRYPTEEQFAVVAIESVRAGCVVVGEDLGTVPTEVREAMERHRVLRSFVAEFSMPTADGEPVVPDHRSVASVATHDTPTFRGFVRGDDIDAREAAGRVSAEEAAAARAERDRACGALELALRTRGLGPADDLYDQDADDRADPLLGGLLSLLGESDAPAVLVGIDDLLGETDPQNVPGTGDERPNWVLRCPLALDELMADTHVAALLDRLQGARLASHVRAGSARAAQEHG
jgi:4-alpha-glucanotransferase